MSFNRTYFKILLGFYLSSFPSCARPAGRGEYNEYVDHLEIQAPSFLNAVPDECNELTQQQRRQEIHRQLEQEKDEHTIDTLLQERASLSISLANCKYKNDKVEYSSLLKDAAQHYEMLGQFEVAGRIYHKINEIAPAQECFKKDTKTIEETMKITPREKLLQFRDEFLAQGDYWKAGKISWYLGDQISGRALIENSSEYGKAHQEAERLMQQQRFRTALNFLWRGEILPFYRELMLEWCGSHQDCQQEVKAYDPLKNRPIRF